MEYTGDEGIKVTGGKAATLERPNYDTQSDADILGIDDRAPDLGDLGPLGKDGKPLNKSAEPSDSGRTRTVRLDDENRVLEDDDETDAEVKDKKPADAKGDELEDEEKPDDKAKPEEKPAEPLTPLKVSEELKAHFADPTVGKQLKTAFYKAAAYEEIFPDFQAAKQIAELFPSAEEARHVSESYEGFRELQEAYESSPTTFVAKLHEEGAEEFVEVARAIVDSLPELHPEAYADLGQRILADTLAYCIESTGEIVAKSGLSAENLIAAANVIAMNLFGGKDVRQLMTAAPDPQQRTISKLKTELKQERESKGAARYQDFLDVALTEADTQIDKSIDGMLTKILDVEGVAVSKAARLKIGEEIKAAVAGDIKATKRIGEAVVDLIKAKGGDFSDEHLKRAIAPMIQHANLAIRKHAGQIVPNYTRNILQSHEQKIDKQRQAAERKDAGNGGGPRVGGERGASVTPDQIDYSRTSDDDILNDRVTLRR